jgi:hypothetical protein
MMAGSTRPFLLNKPTGALAPVGLDRARRLAWWDVQRTDINQKIDPATDPTHSHWIHKLHLQAGPTFLRGRVVDSIAYTNCHKVQFGMWGTMWCQMLTPTATQPMGARHIGQLSVGCEVLVLWHKDDNSGIIIGVIPDAQTNSQTAMADFISQQARSGLLVDEAHHYPVCLPHASLITDWSAGRPLDATTEGEQGNITETGLLDFIDSFMTLKRVDEECGLWTFWHDQMTRLAGHNFQLWTAGYEREDLDDEGEFDKIEGHTPYYWEALGAFELGINVSREIPTKCWQKDPNLQGYSGVEPCDDHQQAFYRLRDFYGYLGQAHKRILVLPPVDDNSSDQLLGAAGAGGLSDICSSEHCDLSSCAPDGLNTLSQKHIYPGVFEENLTLTGRYAVRSAHEIILSKHVLIPGPKQMARPEDPRGDGTGNYRAAGHPAFGSGQEHKVVGEIRTPDGDDVTQIRAAGFLDTHAFVFNWIGDHPFYYHKVDWYLPEEAGLKYLAGDKPSVAFDPPYFDELQCHHFLNAPKAIPIKVDHRYHEVKYYPNHSYFALLADGGIVIGDGFGAELKLANGSVWVTAPGDVNLMAGRDVVSFAGHDLIMRAKNSFDLTATKRDGRIKAKRNLWMAATGECGGILIESMAKGAWFDAEGKTGEEVTLGGIVIKAKDSILTQHAADMSFSLSKGSQGPQQGAFSFDAGLDGRVRFKSQFFERFLGHGGAALDFWTAGECGGIIRGAEYREDGALICTPLVVTDSILSAKCIGAQQDLVSLRGHVITKQAKKTNNLVGGLQDGKALQDKLDEFKKRANATLPQIGEQELESHCDRLLHYSCTDAEFSFRSVKQYRTTDFVLFESRWQQLARVGGAGVNFWVEEGVRDTYPYPGKEKLLGTSYRTLDPKLYDVTTGVANARGAAYEDPEFNTPERHVLNDMYTVII